MKHFIVDTNTAGLITLGVMCVIIFGYMIYLGIKTKNYSDDR